MPVGAYALSFHSDTTYVGEQFFLVTNTAASRIGATHDVAARIALLSPSKKYEFAVYGKNLTDNRVTNGMVTDSTTQTKFATVPYPRRFGVELAARF